MGLITYTKIEINGKPLKDFDRVSINQNMYGIDYFEIICRFDSVEKADGFIVENAKDFLGLPIVILLKEEGSEQEALFFKGYVTEVKGRRSGLSENDQIVISGGSSEIILNRKPTNRAFLDKTLDEIVKEVLKPYPINSSIKSRDKLQYPYIVQYEESDLEFIKRLSIRYGEWFFFNGKEIIFGEIPESEQKLTVGHNLTEFNFELRVNPVKFNLCTVDPLKMDVYRTKSGSGKVDSNLNIYGKHALKQSKQMFPEEGNDYFEHLNVKETDFKKGLERVSEINEIKDAINLTDLSGSSTNGFLIPGMYVMVNCPKDNPKETVSYGRHLITSVNHSFDNLYTYQNNFTAIPAESTLPEYTNPYYVKETQNQLGMVADNKDPKKLGRVKISFWWMEGKQMSPWVKSVTPYVHKNSGFFFVPAVNSRVLVGFEDGDVEKPYCLGNLFDEDANPDPTWAGNANEKNAKIHAIRTKSGNTIEFHESEGEEKITIYDKDDQNRITLDSANGTLTIHATDTLNIKANKINIEAEEEFNIACNKIVDIKGIEKVEVRSPNGEIRIASLQDMKIDGNNVNIGAMTSVIVEANATAELSANGNTVVKGAIVQIN